MNLLIISHTPHYQANRQIFGWGPTIREIDHLANLFTHVVHLAPLHPGTPTPMDLAYDRDNISFFEIKPAGGDKIWKKLQVVWQIPSWIKNIKHAVENADAIHIRCPAGISLIGLLGIHLWGREKPIWVKYAGNWQPVGKAPLSYKLQRWLLIKNWPGGVVTVNGQWTDQPHHIYPFDNPSLTQSEYARAAALAHHKQLTQPIQLLFIGRVERAKGVHHLLRIAERLEELQVNFKLTLVGDSPNRSEFEKIVSESKLDKRVHFTGWQKMTDLHLYYQEAHILIFPSISEGWPKVISEAMAHGVVPIASAISSIPQTLGEVGAGKAFPPDQIEMYVEAICNYIKNPALWEVERDRCIQAGVRYTYQAYLDAVISLFKEAWQIELRQ